MLKDNNVYSASFSNQKDKNRKTENTFDIFLFPQQKLGENNEMHKQIYLYTHTSKLVS